MSSPAAGCPAWPIEERILCACAVQVPTLLVVLQNSISVRSSQKLTGIVIQTVIMVQTQSIEIFTRSAYNFVAHNPPVV